MTDEKQTGPSNQNGLGGREEDIQTKIGDANKRIQKPEIYIIVQI